MPKCIVMAGAATLACTSAFAGGIVTNTNQSAAYLRMMSREATIDIASVYENPAGMAFLGKGAHVSFNLQNARQKRDVTATYGLLSSNLKYAGQANNNTRKFEGTANAPIIPSYQFSYNWDRWSINSHFGATGGGGKAEFDEGIGTFESLYAARLLNAANTQVIPAINAGVQQKAGVNPDYAYNGYTLSSYMKGQSYYFGLSVGAAYKVLENLSVFVGSRLVYATNSYEGEVTDLTVHLKSQLPSPYYESLAAAGVAEYQHHLGDEYALELNTDQTGFGWTPMIGADWKLNDQWNFAFKYEFKTRLRLKNDSKMNANTAAQAESNATLAQFKDGTTIKADIPGTLYAGVQYSPIQQVRIAVGYHYYDDKNATQYGNKQDLIDDNTWEATAGVEWDINKWITVSAGWQTTQYGLSDAYMNDISFVCNSHTYGLGARLHLTDRMSLDAGFMQTLYQDREVTTANYIGSGMDKTDLYHRTNRVIGLGLNFDF